MIPLLAYDVCRCHALRCPERESCLRWLDRDNWGYVHAASLSNDDGTCTAKLPSDQAAP